jgi:hypothetical protein
MGGAIGGIITPGGMKPGIGGNMGGGINRMVGIRGREVLNRLGVARFGRGSGIS